MKQRFLSMTTLTELAAALLIFMLASVTVLGLFTTAYDMSTEAREMARALETAQDAAAIIAGADDPEAMLLAQGYAAGETLDSAYTRALGGRMQAFVTLREEQTEVGNLLTAEIRVGHDEENLCTLHAARYYNKEVMHP